MSFESEYVFPFTLTKELKQEIQSKTQQRLTEMLGVEVDTVMAVRNILIMASYTDTCGPMISCRKSANDFIYMLRNML